MNHRPSWNLGIIWKNVLLTTSLCIRRSSSSLKPSFLHPSLNMADLSASSYGSISTPESTRLLRKPITFSDTLVPADVEIQIFNTTYHLQSAVLRTFSKFFDKSMSSTWWKPENTHKGTLKYRYQLALDCDDPMCSMIEPVGPGLEIDIKECICMSIGSESSSFTNQGL